jgi:hypothetical protein
MIGLEYRVVSVTLPEKIVEVFRLEIHQKKCPYMSARNILPILIANIIAKM